MTNEAGLQFEGVPSDRAIRAAWLLPQVIEELEFYASIEEDGNRVKNLELIIEALELMAQEKTNG